MRVCKSRKELDIAPTLDILLREIEVMVSLNQYDDIVMNRRTVGSTFALCCVKFGSDPGGRVEGDNIAWIGHKLRFLTAMDRVQSQHIP